MRRDAVDGEMLVETVGRSSFAFIISSLSARSQSLFVVGKSDTLKVNLMIFIF